MPEQLNTLTTRHSSAHICRANLWPVGAILEGDVLDKSIDRAPKRIEITAIGLRAVMAVEPGGVEEFLIDLHVRQWRRVIR